MKDRLWTGRGFQLEGNTFAEHLHSCEQCRHFDETKPATAALCCLDGSILLKQDAAKNAPKKPTVERSGNYATKAQIKAAMRYK